LVGGKPLVRKLRGEAASQGAVPELNRLGILDHEEVGGAMVQGEPVDAAGSSRARHPGLTALHDPTPEVDDRRRDAASGGHSRKRRLPMDRVLFNIAHAGATARGGTICATVHAAGGAPAQVVEVGVGEGGLVVIVGPHADDAEQHLGGAAAVAVTHEQRLRDAPSLSELDDEAHCGEVQLREAGGVDAANVPEGAAGCADPSLSPMLDGETSGRDLGEQSEAADELVGALLRALEPNGVAVEGER
jgi:hypothetical protein